MRRILLTAVLVSFAVPATANDTYVRGYTRNDGTYVQPHHRSGPDKSYNNNWSVQGNTNPYTGERGSSRPTWDDKQPSTNNLGLGGSRPRW
jgi:hypothetical protein